MKKQYIIVIASIVFMVIVYFYRVKIKNILLPFFLAGIIAYILMPIVNWLEKHKFSRLKAIFIVYGLIILIISLTFYYILPLIIGELTQVGKLMPYYFRLFNDVESLIRKRYSNYLPPQLRMIIDSNINSINSQISLFITKLIKSIFSILSQSIGFILSPIIAFYLIKDSKELGDKFLMLFPGKYRSTFKEVFIKIDKVIKEFLYGQLLVAFFVALATSIGLYLIGLNFSILIGIIAGIFNIVPYLGPIVSGGLAVIIGLAQSPYKAMSAVIIFLIVHQLESGVFSPKIVGDSVGLHPVIIIFSLLAGEEFFGIIGMLLAIPVVATIKVILYYVIDNMDRI